MKRHATGPGGAGSLDMLLDTMCNTFGGVCFIALTVAILSALLPPPADADGGSARLVEDSRRAEMARRRADLQAAVELQRDLVRAFETNLSVSVSAADVARRLADNRVEQERLRARAAALDEAIRKAAASDECSRREWERLRRLADDLERRTAEAKAERTRAVRTPVEREIAGMRPFDLWFRGGKMFVVHDERQVSCREGRGADGGVEWRYACRPGAGTVVNGECLAGSRFSSMLSGLGPKRFVRMYADKESFPALCRVRDALVSRGVAYNWHWHDSPELVFVEGSDTRVQ